MRWSTSLLSASVLFLGLGSCYDQDARLERRVPAASSGSQSFQSQCQAFASKISANKKKFENPINVHAVTYVPAGANVSTPTPVASCAGNGLTMATPVEFCQVTLNVTTSNTSQIYMEAWLPGNYSGRFLSTGNGGLGGCIQYSDMLYATQWGFATVGTNNGHNGNTGQFFLNNPEVLEDFAYRAMHTGVVIGKQLTKLFYPQTPNGYKKSYYLGCSTGGREGWKSVEKFPDDFDGVLAGSPAIDFVNLSTWGSRFLIITGTNTSASFVTASQWGNLVHNEILRQCDGLDGAVDGIIEDPDLCHPVFETLLCNSTNTSVPNTSPTCLTGDQVNAVNQVFTGMFGTSGELMYPRMQPGSEIEAAYVYYSGSPMQYPEDWNRYVVFNDSNWNPYTWTIEDGEIAARQNPFDIMTWDSDLVPAFGKKGGKILHYHGMEDPIISSENSKRWYKYVADTTSTSPSQLDEYYRYFRISGMSHCAPGTGASYIGQGFGTYVNGSQNNPQDNVLTAIVQWVEEGVAPEFVRGAKLASNGSVEYTRKHCKYPKRNQYVGPGNYTDENAWECVI